MPDILKNREEKDFMYRIFIVEDDRGIAQAIQEQAEMWGLQAKCAGDFRNVLAEFAGYDPHLVLLDISLPEIAVRSGRSPRCPLSLFPPRRTI